MRARDLMTPDPVTFQPGTPIAVAARAMAERGFSGAPVVDAKGRLLGMLTEGDLLRRLAAPADAPRSWIAGLFESAAAQADRFARAHGQTAGDAMTRGAVTAEEDTPLETLAKAMEERAIRRIPVLRDGRLVGIVSRADLIRALLQPSAELMADAPDERIRRALAKAMKQQPWIDAYAIFFDVKNGVVSFHGYCRDEAVLRGLKVLAQTVPGVRGVTMMVERSTAEAPAG
ncbi:CBS domain-containing protein [Falsiroseomonas tokyonensis]|uniref:CBS domain-containing protein n=1 Tax=Falsiroseomonas tokyonensis TaxID=430521 RepID=A0ABV7BQ84_9PROT|nr:CBS domain-containing protein [Falsiroseomonas tokyonensis]MBU8537764.1 CBS domain-containing protein [Falsiroseomonas tokyonensis]